VEPTGQIEHDPELMDEKSAGNPTMSYHSREPLRVTGEVTDWQGHSPEALKAMKDGLERLERLGVEPIDDLKPERVVISIPARNRLGQLWSQRSGGAAI
jgi:rifampin ADP-ribosylating transferase